MLALSQGKYAEAVSIYADTKTNNAAVAQILDRDYNKAMQTLNAIANPDAMTSYLKAIVAARTNDAMSVVENLRKAIELDRSLAALPQMIWNLASTWEVWLFGNYFTKLFVIT